MDNPTFGPRLRALRLERGLSQAALAEGGLSTGYLSRLESGARQPTERVLVHLSARLGVPLSAFEGDDRPRALSLAQVLAAVTSAMGTGAGGAQPVADDGVAEVLQEALAAEESQDSALRWQALWLLAGIRSQQSRYDEENTLLAELVSLSDELASQELRARGRTRRSRCLRLLGDTGAARRLAQEAHELAAELPVDDRAAALHALISAEAEAGVLGEARAHADELCALTEDARGKRLVEALWASATVHIRQGDHANAQRALDRALEELDSHRDLTLWVRLRLAAASLHLQTAQPRTDRVRAVIAEVEPVVTRVGSELHQQQLRVLLAQLAFAEDRLEEAAALCAAVAADDLLLSFRDRIRFQALRGSLMLLDGRVEAGTALMHDLAGQAQQARNVELAAEVWRGLAKTLAKVYGLPAAADPAVEPGPQLTGQNTGAG
ncbi:helix-turn-helix domain-containing protein [Actinokineospora sp. NBRC 105648]|uniref:helix-turn-helix domain-containing protein n=1 Tax=Actinokineospora sp. NBRC 105648 TaxID=3032206 RepID=UPI0024A0D2FF|nr:helix-turn-helix domain-containing protein [Actinokineospora sp. NBRC 105648]GLZ38121.1 hypothetical protein Acsp05_17450 [Actinokineospora sp. NBRC 105648]